MNHKRPPIPAIIILLIVIGFSIYFIVTQARGADETVLTASGAIEAVQANVASEIAGKVTEVFVDEGEPVSKNQPLLRLDPNLLEAQRAVASAAVDSANAALAAAQTKYDQAYDNAIAAQSAQRAKDWQTAAPSEFDQPNWYLEQDEQLAAAQTELEAAKADIAAAIANLDKVINRLDTADYIAAEQKLAEARAAFIIAEQVKAQASDAPDNTGLLDAAQDYYDDTLSDLNDAQEDYNDLLDTEAADDVEYARGKVLVAQQRYDAAYARLLSLQTGAVSPAVINAAKEVDKAKSALLQAEANLAVLETQITKLTVNSPMDGVVLTRNIEPGEFVQPGATTLSLGNINELTITVYIPENRYGEIFIGQSATLTVDSFPDIAFTAKVIQIADKAEFTPRNVQTVEGRSSTVFAVKLRVDDPEGKLKIGMPADVVFK